MDLICESQRLRNLAEGLQSYKPPCFKEDEEVEEEEARAGKVIPPSKSRPKKAAVLVCLFEGDAGDLRVILTKRSSNMSTHSGEVSLPGGKVEEGDSDYCYTATREAKEEIGLDPSLVTVITVLETFVTKRQQRVVPVIGILSDKQAFKPVASASEVETIFDAPLEMFLEDGNQKSEEREWMETRYFMHFFYFEAANKKYVIWGLTAWILILTATVVYKRSPAFMVQRPNFRIRNTVTEGDSIP